jgi:hypothetical protein
MTRKNTLVCMLALMGLAATESLSAKVVAKFESIIGAVQYREKKGKWQNAKLGSPLNDNTELQTGPTGKATLLFPNGTKVTLKPGTLASLDQYTAGSYVRNHFRVRTPTVVAGVRGSNTDISNGTSTNIQMNEHSMDVRNNAGQQIRVPQGGSSQISRNEMVTSDKMETKNSMVTMVSSESASAGEAEMAFFAGDSLFSSNSADFDEFVDFADFLEFLDYLNFANDVTFEKL